MSATLDFDALVIAHRDALFRYALRRVGDPHDAADVVADALLVAWRRREAMPSDPLPWLYGVARRVLADHRRAQGRRAALAERLASEHPRGDGADHAHSLAARDEMRRALNALSERDREVLMLVAWEDLDPTRAAIALGCRPATLHVRLHRARRRLAAALAASGETASPPPVVTSETVTAMTTPDGASPR